MKKILIFIFLLFFGTIAIGQCNVDLGDDIVRCSNDITPTSLAANISVTTPGGNPYTLTWDNGIGVDSNPQVIPGIATTYTVTMTDGLGCTDTDEITVLISHPVADAGPDVHMCEGIPAQLDGTGSSGNLGLLIYNWQNGVDDNSASQPYTDVNGLASLSLVVFDYVSNTLTCTSEPDQVAVFFHNSPIVNAGNDIAHCASSFPENVLIPEGTSSGGDWSGVNVTPGGDFTANAIGPTTLTYSYEDNFGCIGTDDLEITISVADIIDVETDFGICLNSPAVQLQTNSGSWSGSPLVTPGGLFTPSAAGTYNLTYSEVTGPCTATDNIEVTVYELPQADAGTDITICASTNEILNGTVVAGDNPVTTYSWSGGNIVGANDAIDAEVNPSAQTTYTFTISDAEGCTATDDIIVSTNSTPIVNAGADVSICHDTPAEVINLSGTPVAGGGETGVWSGTGVTANGVFTDPGVGNYTLTYTFTDANNCFDTDELEVNVVAPNNINLGLDQEFCLNDADHQLPQPDGGTWSGTDVTPAGLFSPSTVGNHVLDYDVTIGSCVVQSQLNVTVYGLPTADAGADFGICNGSSGQLNGSGATANGSITAYNWTNGSNIDDNTLANPTVSPTTNQNYILTVTDTEGCQETDDIQITINTLPNVDAGADITLCDAIPAEIVNLSGTPVAGVGETGIWSGVGVTAGGVFTNPGVGTYTLDYTFTDANGCINDDQMTITVISPDNVDVGPNLETCLDGATIQLTQPGTWTGSNVTANGVFTPSTQGVQTLDFEVVVGQCTAQAQLEINVLGLPQVNAGSDTQLCAEEVHQMTGSATTPNGFITNFLWSNGSDIETPNAANTNISPNTTQTYILTATDNKGCVDQDEITITIDPLPVVNAGQNITLCNQPIAETLTGFSPAGGTWTGVGISNPTGEFTPTGLGTYTVTYTYTDLATTCSNSADIVVTVVAPESIDAGSDEELCVADNPLTLTGFAPVANITWSGTGITDPSGVFDPSVSGAGDFTLTISYGTGTCLVQDTKEISVLDVPTVEAGTDQSLCIDVSSFDLSGATPSGGTWSGTGITDSNNGTFDPGVSGTGIFTLTYAYTNMTTGCSNTDTKTVEILALPTADFTISAEQCQNSNIDITNNSSGATIFEWDFANGDDDDVTSPIYAYTTPGDYTVSLEVSNAGGCTSTTSQSISVLELATANFTVSELNGCGSLDVDFDNTSTGDDVSYVWDFDNSQPTYNNTTPPTTTFTELDNDNVLYSINLTATNSCNTDNATINILVQSLPVASFTTDATEYCTSQVPVTNTSIGNPTDFSWDFGGLGASIDENPAPYNFSMGANAIDYNISLEVSNICGTDVATETITILPAALTADFTTDVVQGCVPLTINVTDQSNGATDYDYDFGDGGLNSIVDSPTYTYNTAGTYVLNQEVSNLCNTELHSLTITVLALPSMDFSSSNTSFCHDQAVQFVNNTPDLENIAWNFGDGNTGNTPFASNTFLLPGTYDVNLSGTSISNGCAGTITESITINETPIALFTPTDIEGCSPYEVSFDNTTGGMNSTDWVFGDGALSSDTDAIHTFINLTDDIVVYTTEMTSTTDDNCSNTFQTEISVKPSPQIDFELSEYESCEYPVTVSTTNNTSNADSYSWNISTQGTFTSPEPEVTLISPGDFNFTLIAQNNFNCTSVETQTFTVYEKPIVSYLADINSGCSNLEVQFNNQTTGATSFEWDFGDGTLSTDESPLHIYLNPGDYNVKLKAYTSIGCLDSLGVDGMIEVHDSPTAEFSFSPEEVDIFDPMVTFTDLSVGVELWHWDFGDGATSVLTNPEHEYEHPGVYPVVLSVINEYGCTDAFVQDVEVTNDLILFVPNSFTPNEDGFNDIFTPSILGKEFTAEYLFQIYNKWGQVIFESKDPSIGWDGNAYVGKFYVPEGVYNWHIEFRLKTNVKKEIRNGTVYLFR